MSFLEEMTFVFTYPSKNKYIYDLNLDKHCFVYMKKSSQKILYLIPGLGFDHRIFSQLDLGDYVFKYIDWIKPMDISESIDAYALRMASEIQKTDLPIVLIGHSFGGVMAQEIAQLKTVEKVIILSSIKSQSENRPSFRAIAPFNLQRFFSKKLTLSTFRFWGKYYGYETKEEQDLFRSMVDANSDEYLQWALLQLSKWKGIKNPKSPVFHIHGDNDKTLPFKFIKDPVHIIEGGGHIMLYKQPKLISKLILEEIKTYHI